MQVFKKILVSAVCLLAFCDAKAQLKVDTSRTVENMVSRVLMGKGVQIGNIRMKGGRAGIGYFQVASNVIGMRSGLLLSTGKVHDAVGPNNVPGRSGVVTTAQTIKNKEIGDPDLNRLCGSRTLDVMVLEFDFIPQHNKVSFRYCFGSEEYREYVGSRFNDVFGFFIEGADLPKQNLAVIPGTDEPVAVNNVNHKKFRRIYLNNDYFVDPKTVTASSQTGNGIFHKTKMSLNDDARLVDERERRKLDQDLVTHFQYDGFTKVLTAECRVTPNKKYHLKLAIGDVGDYALDSGVFLEAGSFSSEADPALPHYKELVQKTETLAPIGEKDDMPLAAGNKADVEMDLPVKELNIFRTTNVHFATDSYEIPDTAKTMLDRLAAHLLRNKTLVGRLYGHTDNVGGKDYNQTLSENRALSVIKYLASKGIPEARLTYAGHNFAEPIADNDKVQGRWYNRRVEITLIDAGIQALR